MVLPWRVDDVNPRVVRRIPINAHTIGFIYGGRREMDAGFWWLLFGIVAGLLPLYLIIRTILHVLNIDLREMRR